MEDVVRMMLLSLDFQGLTKKRSVSNSIASVCGTRQDRTTFWINQSPEWSDSALEALTSSSLSRLRDLNDEIPETFHAIAPSGQTDLALT